MRSAACVALLFILSSLVQAQIASPTGHKAGGASSPSDSGFQYKFPPVLQSIDPVHGPVAGGTMVILTGKYFTTSADTTVTMGGAAAGDVTVLNSSTITCTTPAHAAARVTVTVTNSSGSDSLTNAFTFYDPPVIVSIDPNIGPTAGGAAVTITGSGFTDLGPTTVAFNGTGATDVVVVDESTITCTTPAHASGAVDVTVMNDFGSDVLINGYTFQDLPQIVSIDPNIGPTTGGTAVTITGSGFIGVTTVTFGGTSATDIVVVDESTITCTTPAHGPGIVDVTVTNPYGSDTLINGYTYNDPAIHVPGDYPTIQQAIDAAYGGDTILVAPGTYVENILFPSRDIVVRSDLDGQSGTLDIAPYATFIDGNQVGTVVIFQSGPVANPSLVGFTIVNGYNPSFDFTAGGIYCEVDSSPTIVYNHIIGNRCDFGTGGLRSDASYSSHTIEGNVIAGNVSLFGGSGGMMVEGENASHMISGNIIAGNRAEANSGGLSVTGINSSHGIINNFISGNAGQIGGGLSIGGWDSNLLTITNNTITNNHAVENGGGLAVGGWLVADLTNTILWNNTAPFGPQISMNTAVFGTSELYAGSSDVEGGEIQVHVDPTCTLYWGSGMMDAMPGLHVGPTGTWTANGVYDAVNYRITLTDTAASWTVNEFSGLLINPDTMQPLELVIVSNTSNTITIWADWETIDAGVSWILSGSSYRIHDVHLDAGSLCIDMGDNYAPQIPAKDIDGEDRIVDGDGDLVPVVDMGADEHVP